MQRLFVAIELSESCKRGLVRAQRSLSMFDGMVRWTPPEQMHLTLKFFGDTPEEQVPEICDELNKACEGFSPLGIELRGSGCFPPCGNVRVIWVGIEGEVESLCALHRTIESRLESAGVAAESRAYAPHLTIGRVRQGKHKGNLRESVTHVRVSPVSQLVDSVTLMESKLSAQGAIHTRIHRRRLSGAVDD